MVEEDEFEFDFDEEEEEMEGSRKKNIRARKIPISDGVKKRLIMNMREIKKLKEEFDDLKHDNKNLESEIEMIEDEMEKHRIKSEKVQQEVNQKVAIATALEKKYERTQKDFENYKKRIEKDIDRKSKMGAKKLIMGIVETLDNFERAIKEMEKMDEIKNLDSLVGGVKAIQKSLINNLKNSDVDMIDPKGDMFDPLFHEAIETEFNKKEYENTILKVESKGYILDGILLRPAKVIVSRGGPSPPKKKKPQKKDDGDENSSHKEDEEEIGDIVDEEEMEDEVEDMEELEEFE